MITLVHSLSLHQSRAATCSRMLEYPHGWQLLGYDFSYPNIPPQKKKKSVHADAYPCLGERQPLAWCRRKKCFPTQELSNSPNRNWDQMSGFLFWLVGKWIILPSLVFKTALFTVIIIIKSVPSTATRSKIACVFGDRTGILLQRYGGGKNKNKSKNQKNSKKFKKKHGVQIFKYSLVSLGVYSGTSLHCCTQPYTRVQCLLSDHMHYMHDDKPKHFSFIFPIKDLVLDRCVHVW